MGSEAVVVTVWRLLCKLHVCPGYNGVMMFQPWDHRMFGINGDQQGDESVVERADLKGS